MTNDPLQLAFLFITPLIIAIICFVPFRKKLMLDAAKSGEDIPSASQKGYLITLVATLTTFMGMMFAFNKCFFPTGVQNVPDRGYNPSEALCYNKKGKGRKILALALNNQKEIVSLKSFPENSKDIRKNTGIKIEWAKEPQEAARMLASGEFAAFWMIDLDPSIAVSDDLISALKKHMEQGRGLILSTDNYPYFKMSNAILSQLKPDWKIKIAGNDPGQKKISKEEFLEGLEGTYGVLYQHPVSSGIYHNISEGHSISYVQSTASDGSSIIDSKKFRKIVKNSSGNISVSAIEEPVEGTAWKGAPKKQGKAVLRVVMHGGFTSLYRATFIDGISASENTWTWDSTLSPATPLFFENIACYAVGK